LYNSFRDLQLIIKKILFKKTHEPVTAFHREEALFLFVCLGHPSRGDLHRDVRQAPNALDVHLIGADAAPVEDLQLGRVQAVG
jgi:hypothetical protein